MISVKELNEIKNYDGYRDFINSDEFQKVRNYLAAILIDNIKIHWDEWAKNSTNNEFYINAKEGLNNQHYFHHEFNPFIYEALQSNKMLEFVKEIENLGYKIKIYITPGQINKTNLNEIYEFSNKNLFIKSLYSFKELNPYLNTYLNPRLYYKENIDWLTGFIHISW